MQWTVFLVQRSVAVKSVNMMSKNSQIQNYKYTANISSGALRGQTLHLDPRQLRAVLTIAKRASQRQQPIGWDFAAPVAELTLQKCQEIVHTFSTFGREC